MEINKVDNTSFGQINLIRVRKSAFKNPDKLHQCSVEFDKMISKIEGDKIGSTTFGYYLNLILHKLGKKATTGSEILGRFNFRPIDKPLEKGYHSFVLFTGEDKEIMWTFASREKSKEFSKKAKEEIKYKDYKQDGSFKDFIAGYKKYTKAYISRIFELVSEQSQKMFVNTKVHEFKVEDLKELESIQSKLGL
jgi:hypothetical protein